MGFHMIPYTDAQAQATVKANVKLGDLQADTLANLNAKVSDATLDDQGATRTPTAHQALHQKAAADALAGTIAVTQVEVG